MIVHISKKLLSIAIVSMMLFAVIVVGYAKDADTVKGVVLVDKNMITLDTSLGKIVVKKGDFSKQLRTMNGKEVTVTGVISEDADGAHVIKIQTIEE